MKQLLIILFFSAILVSCKKKDEESCATCAVGGSVATPAGFTYSKNNAAAIKADSAFFIPVSKTIVAYYPAGTRIVIKTNSQSPGVYTFTSTANTLTYVEALGNYNATNGSITITANANNKMSGSFSSIGAGSASTISGQFQNIVSK